MKRRFMSLFVSRTFVLTAAVTTFGVAMSGSILKLGVVMIVGLVLQFVLLIAIIISRKT